MMTPIFAGRIKFAPMANLKILVWKSREGTGAPDVEVTVPAHLSKWVSRMMRFTPKDVKVDWGEDQGVDHRYFSNARRLEII